MLGALTLAVGVGLAHPWGAGAKMLDAVRTPGGLSGLPDPPAGLNVLLMGTDGRDTVTAQEKKQYRLGGVACNCTDTLMVVHVSARRDHVSVVSLPRDSYARLPEHQDRNSGEHHPEHAAKLNGAYAEGGPELSARTVESMTGLRIDRTLQVDFRRFLDSVDHLGGVPVCTTRPLRDSVTALDLPAGTQRLAGGQALQYVRSRHVDTLADLGRIKRQQHFLLSAAQQVAARAAGGPKTLGSFASLLLPRTRTERALTTAELIDLGHQLRNLAPARTQFATVPISGTNDNKDRTGSTLQWDEEAAPRMFADMAADRPLTRVDGPDQDPARKASATVTGSALACS